MKRLFLLIALFMFCSVAQGACIVKRDEDGRIKRSATAIRQFKKITGYPNGRPGYIIDHIKPLACCGKDEPSNMQWQTVAAAKEKDKWERKTCGGTE